MNKKTNTKMKRTLILISFLVIAAFTKAQNENKIVIGKTDTIFSKILNETRKILLYTPNFTSLANLPNQRYPVLYLLDGEAHFVSTVGLVQQLSQANGNAVLPEMIVVGITNTNRFRDLTPSATGTGGGYNFMKFI
jgi:predicted alpha/beta superfamily hydrolase